MSETCLCGAEKCTAFSYGSTYTIWWCTHGQNEAHYTCGMPVGQEESCLVWKAQQVEPIPVNSPFDRVPTSATDLGLSGPTGVVPRQEEGVGVELCRHEEISFGSGGWEIFCLNCSTGWTLRDDSMPFGHLTTNDTRIDPAQIRSLQAQVEELEMELERCVFANSNLSITADARKQTILGETRRAEQAESERDALKKEQEACRGTANDFLDGRPLPPNWQDGTDAACPGWWRGHDHGAAGMEKKLKSERDEALAKVGDDIRAAGWAVAVHNDYHQDGKHHTFWLFTKSDRSVKGEGANDAEALNQIREQLNLPTAAQALLDKANEAERLKADLDGLLYQVGSKYPGESRYETAKRFIKEAQESRLGTGPSQALTPGEPK